VDLAYIKSQERVLLGGAVQNITSGAYHSCGLLLTGEVRKVKCCVKKVYPLHPGRLTWNLKMIVWKMIFLFNRVIFRFHVNLPGCKFAWPTIGFVEY